MPFSLLIIVYTLKNIMKIILNPKVPSSTTFRLLEVGQSSLDETPAASDWTITEYPYLT